MKKSLQLEHNTQVVNAMESFKVDGSYLSLKGERLNHCRAWIYETANYWVLESYTTIFAVIDKNDGTLYDFSRLVYGYTATTSQHIAKFARKFVTGAHYVWKEV